MAKDYDLVFQDSNTGALKNAGNRHQSTTIPALRI